MSIKKLFIYCTLILCSLSLTSCFEIIEEIKLFRNGSGEVVLTFNLSQSKTRVASVMLLDSINGYKVPSKKDINYELNAITNNLRNSTGISKVNSNVDFNNYIATISFSFKEVSNINNVFKNILARQDIQVPNQNLYSFNANNQVFIRKYQSDRNTISSFNKLKKEDKEVFKNAQFTSITRFEQSVKSVNNKSAIVSKSKKAVMLKANMMDLIYDKSNISNQIQLQ